MNLDSVIPTNHNNLEDAITMRLLLSSHTRTTLQIFVHQLKRCAVSFGIRVN